MESMSSSNGPIYNLWAGIVDSLEQQAQKDFETVFMYGYTLMLWRNKKCKEVHVFMDTELPSFLWIATKSKAFLLDLSYTQLLRTSSEIQANSGVSDLLLLRSFNEQIPFLFPRNKYPAQETHRIAALFSRFISRCRITCNYSPTTSLLLKQIKVEQAKTKQNEHSSGMILEISQQLGLATKEDTLKLMQECHMRASTKPFSDKILFTIDQLKEMSRLLQCREVLKQSYEKYSKTKLTNSSMYMQCSLSRKDFNVFLKEVQGETVLSDGPPLSFYSFCQEMMDINGNFAVKRSKLNEGLPLTDYFCFSSHNTYLTGNQLSSDSSIQRYLEDLQEGFKCVELDLHDGPNGPIINHALKGRSLCKPIDFEQTIAEISRHCQAFPNHYPLILSLQNHASFANRHRIHDILFKYLHNRLLPIPSKDKINPCLTLYQLRGKVIIKTDSLIKDILQHSHFQLKNALISPWPALPLKPKPQSRSSAFINKQAKFQQWKTSMQKRSEQFIKNTPYIQFMPLQPMLKVTALFKSPRKTQDASSCAYQCTSLTNTAVESALRQDSTHIQTYTKRSWLRTYPVATEIMSSNYNPIPMMQAGAQIIALNSQTKDEAVWIMRAVFLCGKTSSPHILGYVEKPLFLRQGSSLVNQFIQYRVEPMSNLNVTLKLLATDVDMQFNKQPSSGSYCIKYPDFAFLLISVQNKGKVCLPFRYFLPGIRVVALRLDDYSDSGIRILLKININKQ